jgi:hypothetical protein
MTPRIPPSNSAALFDGVEMPASPMDELALFSHFPRHLAAGKALRAAVLFPNPLEGHAAGEFGWKRGKFH